MTRTMTIRRARTCSVALLAGSFAIASALALDAAYLVGPFSLGQPGAPLPAGWKPLTFRNIPKHTAYALVRDPEAGIVVRAEARQSASGLIRHVDIAPADRPVLRWQWKAKNVIAKGNVKRKDGDDYPARIYVSFRYSPERLSLLERAKYAAARVVYGEYPPHAGLNYIWDSMAPVGTIVPNPFTDRVKMIVVESGPQRLRQWLLYERDIVADYRAAFGEDPPPVSGVALMTDADNTGETATAHYGDITLSPRP